MKTFGVFLAAAAVGVGSALTWSAAAPLLTEWRDAPSSQHETSNLATSEVPVRVAGDVFACTPTRVWDGDGPIWCQEGPRIRLAGIAAREVKRVGNQMVDAGCKEGHPCSAVDGVAARDHLIELVGSAIRSARTGHILVRGPVLACESTGSGKGVRTAAWCRNDASGDLSRAMVRDGFAEKWELYWRN